MKSPKLLTLGLMLGATLTVSSAYAAASFTPAEVNSLAAVATIDEGEILVSSVALKKTDDSGVTDLAKMMINQHSSNLNQILEMANNPHFALALAKGTAGKLTQQNNADLTKLGALTGSQFDHAYADAMVTGHEGALHLIDTQLMKTATSDDVKKFLTDTRAVVVQHLDAAKKLQKKLNS